MASAWHANVLYHCSKHDEFDVFYYRRVLLPKKIALQKFLSILSVFVAAVLLRGMQMLLLSTSALIHTHSFKECLYPSK